MKLRFITFLDHLANNRIFRLVDNKLSINTDPTELIKEAMLQAEVFVLADPTEVNKVGYDRVLFEDYSRLELVNQPFRVTVIETLRGSFSIRSPYEPDPTKFLPVSCLVSVEFEPGEYAVFGIIETRLGEGIVPIKENEALPLLNFIFDSTRKTETGSEEVAERVKLKVRGKSEFIRIRRVIHIREKSDKVSDYGSREVDWSHSWSVRGHWRKVESVGKDREGNYTVRGYTWVSNHVKGPDSKDFVSKIRVIKNKPK